MRRRRGCLGTSPRIYQGGVSGGETRELCLLWVEVCSEEGWSWSLDICSVVGNCVCAVIDVIRMV